MIYGFLELYVTCVLFIVLCVCVFFFFFFLFSPCTPWCCRILHQDVVCCLPRGNFISICHQKRCGQHVWVDDELLLVHGYVRADVRICVGEEEPFKC